MGLDGNELWHHDVPSVPGGPAHFNTGGIILWQAGHFTDRRKLDVLLTIRRSMMHTEVTMLLSGEDGREIWLRERQIENRGVGGTPFAIADCDGDGLDDAVLLHPNIYYILKGNTGENLLARVVPYWGLPVAGDFRNDGTKTIFFGTCRSAMTAVLDTKGETLWSDAVDSSPRTMPAFGDFTGSGRMEAVGLGYLDGIRCYDAASGKVLWRMPMPDGNVTDTPASGDIDSDGRDEALFVIGKTLYCLGTDKEGKQGVVKWKLDLPVTVGPPVIADVDGSGLASIVLIGSDGNVYCVK